MQVDFLRPTVQADMKCALREPSFARPLECWQNQRKDLRASAVTQSSRHHSTVVCAASLNGVSRGSGASAAITDSDAQYLLQAARLADSSAGLTAPHPNAGCVLVNSKDAIVAESYQRAQGAETAEVQAIRLAGPQAEGSTVFVNLETNDCDGDDTSIRAIIQSGVSRVVVGLVSPLAHCRQKAITAFRQAGLKVDVLNQAPFLGSEELELEARQRCLDANEALLHRAATGKPLGILKYAMTLDGKIATSSGHSAWVTTPPSRARVFETRSRSDAIIVGGETVRRDNPRLTTRRESGHAPVRMVMSRTLDLPQDANLWDISTAPTIVMTQRGARRDFQAYLLSRGVEVVQFDFLTPEAVAGYCSERGFLQCLWECGGTLAAPAIAGGAIHKCLAFVAPKVIGGVKAPSPVGDLGNVEMTQATELSETRWESIGRDLLLTGYLPSSGGPAALDALLDSESAASRRSEASSSICSEGVLSPSSRPQLKTQVVEFYKAWDRYGALSNFSPHPIDMPEVLPADGLLSSASNSSAHRSWPTLEHYYQAQKFAGVGNIEARQAIEEIRAAASPEEAARIGRSNQRMKPHLVRSDWETAKLFVMYAGLQVKFSSHAGPRAVLLKTATSGLNGEALDLVEAAPHDFFWGKGIDNSGSNHLGVLLKRVRDRLLTVHQANESLVAPTITSIMPSNELSSVSN